MITFPGFLLAYESGRDEPSRGRARSAGCPTLEVGQDARRDGARARTGHETSPPARYTEASLVKALEDRGIGRPSTYASIMGTILDRGYVFKKGTALVPTFLAFAVTQLLEEHFDQLVDYDFTARMEDDLDRIAAGDEERVAWLTPLLLRRHGEPGAARASSPTSSTRSTRARSTRSRSRGTDVVVRVGRYGPYVERGESRVSLPDDIVPGRAHGGAWSRSSSSRPSGERELGTHPETGRVVAAQDGRYGPYVTEVLPEGEDGKPRTASLFQTHVARHGHARRRRPAAHAAADARGPGRRGDRRLERPLRPVREEGLRDAVARERGAAPHAHRRRGARDPRAAEGASRPRRPEAAAQGARARIRRAARRSS